MEEKYSREITLDHIDVALRAWEEKPEVRCKDCGKLGYMPVSIKKRGFAWSVDEHSGPPERWLILEEHVVGIGGLEAHRKLLCPECRGKRGL